MQVFYQSLVQVLSMKDMLRMFLTVHLFLLTLLILVAGGIIDEIFNMR